MARAIQRFEVSLKAFIVREGKALFLRESDSGFWELPGGRIDVGEEWLAHADVLSREIAEELGAGLHVQFSSEAVTWTRQRPTDGAYLFLVARLGRIVAGAPVLSDEHTAMAWLSPAEAETLNLPPASGYREGLRQLWQLAARTA